MKGCLLVTLVALLATPPTMGSPPNYVTRSRAFWGVLASERFPARDRLRLQSENTALASALVATKCTAPTQRLPLENVQAASMGPQWVERADMERATAPGSPTRPGNPLDWFRGLAADGPQSPGSRASSGKPVGRARPTAALMLGLDSLVSLKTGERLSQAALANATLVISREVRLALTPFRFRGSTVTWNATTVWDTVPTKSSRFQAPPLTRRADPDLGFQTLLPEEFAEVEAGYRSAPHSHEAYNRQMRRLLRHFNSSHSVPWANPFFGETATWDAVWAYIATWVVTFIGNRTLELAAAAGAPDYLLHPDRYTDTCNVSRPSPPLGPRTYQWYPLEYCTDNDTFTFRVEEWKGAGYGFVLQPRIQLADVTQIPDGALLDTFHTVFHRTVGLPPNTPVPRPWDDLVYPTVSTYEDCEFQGQQGMWCKNPISKKMEYSTTLVNSPLWQLHNRCWGDYCETWRYPANPWMFHSPECDSTTSCTAKGKCTATITSPGHTRQPVNTRPRFADPYTRQGMQMSSERVAFPLEIDIKGDGKWRTKDLEGDSRIEYREVYTCGAVPEDSAELMLPGDYLYTFYHHYAMAQGVPIANGTTETRFNSPASGNQAPPSVLALAQSVPHYPITAKAMQAAITKLGALTPRIFAYYPGSLKKDKWCQDDASKGYVTCEADDTKVGQWASLQELEWGLWRTRVSGVNASIKDAASALRDDLISHIFTPFASGVARVCGPGPGYLACGATPPRPASSLLQATCADRGTCLYGLPPGPIDWTSSRCNFNPLTPETPCAPATGTDGLAGFDLSIDRRQALLDATTATNNLRRNLGNTPPSAFMGDSVPPGPSKSLVGSPALDPITGTLLCPLGMGGHACAVACGDLATMTGTTLHPLVSSRTNCTALVTGPGPDTGNRDTQCYNPSPTVATPSRLGCSGHGTCFTPGSPEVCVCDPGWQGPFCSRCAWGNWGPACTGTCMSPDPGLAPTDTDQGLRETRVWDPTRSTGVYNLSLCMSSAAWTQAAAPGGAMAHAAPTTVEDLSTACGLWAPAATAAQWLTRARACVLPAPGTAEGIITLGAICNLQPQDCVPYTLSTIHRALGVTPQLLLGCPPEDVWARDRAKWTNQTWAAGTTLFSGRTYLLEAALQPIAEAIKSKGIGPNGVSPQGFLRVPPHNMPSACHTPGVMGVRPGRGNNVTGGCDPWVLQHPNLLALVDDLGTLHPAPRPAPPGPTAPWSHTQESPSFAQDNLREYLCDPIVFRWEMAQRTGVDPSVGLNPVMWGACPPGWVRPRWYAPGAATLCSDAGLFEVGPSSARARHLARLGGWANWNWGVHAARDATHPPTGLGPVNDTHPVDGAWTRTLVAMGARSILTRAAWVVGVDWFVEPGWKTLSPQMLRMALNITGPHFKWDTANHTWVVREEDGEGVPDLLCDIDCQMWVGMGFQPYKEVPGFVDLLQPYVDIMQRVKDTTSAMFTPSNTSQEVQASADAVDTFCGDLWSIFRGILLRPTDAQGQPTPIGSVVWRDLQTNIFLRQNTWSFLNFPLRFFFGRGVPWERQLMHLFANTLNSDWVKVTHSWGALYPWSTLMDLYASDRAPVADHGNCSVVGHPLGSGNCTGTTEVLWGPVGQLIAAIYSDAPGLPLVGLTPPPGVLTNLAPTGTVEPEEGMTSCASTEEGLQCWAGGAINTLVHAGVSPEFEVGCPAALTGRSPEFVVPGLAQPLVISEDTAARMRDAAAVAAINKGPEAPTLCDWDLFVAANPLDLPFQPEFVQADSGLQAPDPASVWDLVKFAHQLLPGFTGGTSTSARVPNASNTGPWNATWVVEPLPYLFPNSSLQQALGMAMDANLGLRGFLNVATMDAVDTLQRTLLALANRTTAPGCFPVSDTPSVWAFTRVANTVPRSGTRVCGGPQRAATCGPAIPGSVTAQQCLQSNFLPCAGGRPPVNTTYYCKCAPSTGCGCAPGSNLDPATNCMTCAFGTVPADLPLTRCTALTACPSVAGVPCSGRGRCFLFGRAANGTRVARPFNSSRVAADSLGLTLLSTSCICNPGWTGDVCTILVPTPPARVRLTAEARVATDPAATALGKGTVSRCSLSGMFVPMTTLDTYWSQCATEDRRSQAAGDECRRSVREVAGRPFFWAYGQRSFVPRLSNIRATLRTDVQACTDAGGALVGMEDLAVFRREAGELYTRVWQQDFEEWAPTKSLTPSEVQWVHSQGGSADFVAHPTITNASFCIRVLTDKGLATYLAPIAGKFIPGVMQPALGTTPYPSTPGYVDAPATPAADACNFWAPPLCSFRNCPRGGSRATPGTTLFQ